MNEDVSDPHPNINHVDLSLKPSMDADDDQHQKKYVYDVFISFRGEDTRRTITSHLERALKERGIETYIDNRLKRGEEISKALLDAIEDSEFSIVIFSKNYATSSWCLDELEHIIQCKKEKMQNVLPVFYYVKPANVRSQKESYADAFVKLEQRFPDTKTRKWRSALTEAANLSGRHISEEDNRNEAELVDEIVKHIRENLEIVKHTRGKLEPPSSIAYLEKGLVGIDKRIKDLDKLLANASKVGICGLGGLGKTTLAEVVFERSRPQFDHGCILKNVREEIEKNGSNHLAKDFIKIISKEENGDLDYAKKRMLSQKKLLLVLDDVDSLEHYEALLEDERDWLNSESKVIITSRNKQVLRNIVGGNENIYDLQILNEEEALKLFLLHAFKKENVEEKKIEFSRKFVDYAAGLPIALKVLGSDLYLKSMNAWQSLLSKLKQVAPDQRVQKVLKVSFDGLEEKEKSIFLDIACFFRGEDKYFVKDILDDRGSFDADIGVLVDKCLITIFKSTYGDNKEILQMHDLLQEMGQSIARGSDRNHLQNHSRLWMSKDICHVLKNNMATTTIEGVYQVDDDDRVRGNLSEPFNPGDRVQFTEVINLDPSTFKKVPCLRLLKLLKENSQIGFEFPRGLDGTFPDKLRFLEWYYYPLESLGSNFTPHNLVHLSMVRSQLKKLWNETQDVNNLKYVNLSHSRNLTCFPNLSKANLQMLRLRGCTSLVDLPPLRFHNILDNAEKESEVMHIYNCLMLQSINHKVYDERKYFDREPERYSLSRKIIPSLSEYVRTDGAYSCLLDLKGCSNLRSLSVMSGNIKFICLRSTAIKELHSSIGYLKNLLVLDLCNCKCIKNLPTSIRNLESLEYLDMFGCKSIEKFPELPKNIKGLDLSRTSIQQVDSSSFECLPCLHILYMNSCIKLESLPTSICKLKSLVRLDLGQCSRLKFFPEILEPVEKLEKLWLNRSGIEVMPSTIENLVVLDELSLRNCENLKCIPTTICKLKSLTALYMSGCSQLKSFPEILEPMEKLKKLWLDRSGIEVMPSTIENLVVLDELDLCSCENLKCIPTTICKLKSLTALYMCDCSQLKSFPEILEPMEKLEELHLNGSGIEVMPSTIENLVVLDELNLRNCENLKCIPTTICKLKSLTALYMSGCSQLKSFPEILEPMEKLEKLWLNGSGIEVMPSTIENLVVLDELNLNNCENLKCIPTTICKLKSLTSLYMCDCSQLKSFPEILEPMEKLKKLRLDGSGIEVMPSTIENLVVLDELGLCRCKNLKCIPTTICKLKSLTALYMSDCSQLKSFPEILEPMEKLEILHLNGSGIEVMPSTIENLVVLDELDLCSCKNLKCIPTTICKLKSLTALYMCDCSQLKSFPEILEPMEKLKKLRLDGSGIEVMPSTIENLVVLDELGLCRCKNLNIPTTICKLKSLTELYMSDCTQLKSFPEILEPMEKLKKLRLDGSGIEVMPSTIENLVVLDELDLCSCKNLKCIPTTICKLKSLTALYMSDCSQLKSFPEILEPMEKLEILHLNGSGIEVMPSTIENLVVLDELDLCSCKNLKCIPTTICKLKSLTELYMSDCTQLKSFPEILEPMEKLKKLWLDGSGIEVMPSTIENLVVLDELGLCRCKNLKCIPTTICKLKSLTALYMSDCSQLKSFPEILEPMEKLKKLWLDRSGIELMPSTIENLVVLDELNLYRCKNLKCIPTTICKLKSLTALNMSGCSQLKSFPEILEPMEKLDKFWIDTIGIELMPSTIE